MYPSLEIETQPCRESLAVTGNFLKVKLSSERGQESKVWKLMDERERRQEVGPET